MTASIFAFRSLKISFWTEQHKDQKKHSMMLLESVAPGSAGKLFVE